MYNPTNRDKNVYLPKMTQEFHIKAQEKFRSCNISFLAHSKTAFLLQKMQTAIKLQGNVQSTMPENSLISLMPCLLQMTKPKQSSDKKKKCINEPYM